MPTDLEPAAPSEPPLPKIGFFARQPLTTWIVLGVVALLAVVAVVLAAGLLRRAPVADLTSPSPEASTAVRSLEPSVAPSVEPQPTPGASPIGQCAGWPDCPIEPFAAVVLVDDLRIRSAAGLSGAPIDALQTNDVLYVLGPPVESDGSDWYNVQGRGNLVGWVSAGPSDRPYLDLRSHLPTNVPATIIGAVAGDHGFLAWGMEAHRAGEAAGRAFLSSSDGSTWQRVSLPAEMSENILGAAWGPAGWIVIAGRSLWRSAEGLSWTALPATQGPASGPGHVFASTSGYLLAGNTGPGLDLWFSVDGQAWRAVESPQVVVSAGVVPVPGGFLRWVTPEVSGLAYMTELAFSTDGRSWAGTGPSLPRGSPNYDQLFGVVGDHVVAIVVEATPGEVGIWRSTLPRPALAWQRQTAAEAMLANTYPTALVSNGSTLLLVGRDRSAATPRLWRSTDGISWTPVPAGALFEGAVPSLVAGGEAGFVAGGRYFPSPDENPILWRAVDGIAWNSEADPILGAFGGLVVGSCPGLPHTQLDWLAIPGSVAVECFGDTPITFDGWLTDSGGCGGYFTGAWEPAWLANPYAMYPIILTPFQAPAGACGSAAQHPSLAAIPGMQQWVSVTGHYDDSAASSCHWTPDAESGPIGIDPAWLVQNCREKFVATSVVPVQP